MTARLRKATNDDLLGVGAVHHRSRAHAYREILSPRALTATRPESLGEYWVERYRWEQDTHRLTVADLAGEIVGFTYVGPSETPGAAELYAIHVDPGLVGSGLGRELMVSALAQLAEVGGDRGVLWVLEENRRARRFYESGGWTPDGGTRVEAISGEPVQQLRYARSFSQGPSLAGGSTRPR
jgi:ribosomal protein S18 acetylase RimI-like enzyme